MDRLREPAEEDLRKKVADVVADVMPEMAKRDYTRAFAMLEKLRPVVRRRPAGLLLELC